MNKARRYYESVRADREAWKAERVAEYGRCWVCRARSDLVVHEIAKRSAAPQRWAERCNYFLACNRCNCGVLENAVIPYMLALKLIYDPAHYDRCRVNELRHRAPDAIDSQEVLAAVYGIACVCLRQNIYDRAIPTLEHVLARGGQMVIPLSEADWQKA